MLATVGGAASRAQRTLDLTIRKSVILSRARCISYADTGGTTSTLLRRAREPACGACIGAYRMSSPLTPPASAKRSRAARRDCSSRRVEATADASESARAPRPAHVPRVSHAEDAARALAAVDAFVPHLEHHALAMHDVADAREALDAALQARPSRARLAHRAAPRPHRRYFPLLFNRAPVVVASRTP